MPKKLMLLSAALAVVVTVAVAGVVSAHSRPIRFEPSPGQVLTAAPASVTGWFTGELRRDPNWNFLQVTDAQGARVDTGETQISSDRRQLTASLKAGLGPGKYQVTWRSFDDEDEAIFGDCYVFYVGQAAADQGFKDFQRIDVGGTRECARIDFEAANGTPTPDFTPASAPAGGDDEASADAGAANTDSGGVPVWTLAAAAILGLAAGAVGMKFVGARG